jgi:hypothetical protein
MQTEVLRLDGNAAGGILRDVFAHEMTVALATCGGCGTVRPLGVLLEYGHGMGVVLRCPTCETPVLRLVSAPGLLRLDLSGILLLTIPLGDSLEGRDHA